MNRNAKALKSGFWYLFANFLVRGMALIATPIFTRLLTKDEFGDYSNFISWTNIAIILITMRMESSLISAKFDYKDNLERYNLSALGLTAVMTAVWTLVINIFSGFFTELIGIRIVFVNLMLLYCFFHAVVNFFQLTERYRYEYKKTVFISILIAVSSLLTAVLMVLNMKDRLAGRIIGELLPTFIIGFVLLVYYIRRGKRIDISTWPYVLKICLPFVPHLLSLQVLNSMDRILITKICGPADNALFSVAYTCGHMVILLMTSLNGAFSPWLGDNLHEEKYEQIKKVTRYYTLIFGAVAVLLILLAPEFLLIMGGKSYLAAKYVMPPVAMGCVCQFVYSLFVNVEQFKKRTIGMAIASVLAAGANYVLNIIFIPKYGYIAAAYTTLASYFLLMLMHLYLVKRIGYSHVFDHRFLALFIAVMMAVTLLINLIYDHSIARFAVIGAFMLVGAFFVWKKREPLLQVLRLLKKK